MSAAAAASSVQQQTRRRPNYPYTLERAPTPRLLKDFLREDNHYHSSTSCSSSGFTSLPRFSTAGNDITRPDKRSLTLRRETRKKKNNNEPSLKRSRSRSRAAAEATFSLLQKLINAVVVRSAAVAAAPRSKKQSVKREEEKKVVVGGEVGTHVAAAVRVRDILRWKSFRDNGINVVDDCDDEEEEEVSSSSISVGEAAEEEGVKEVGRVRVVGLDGSGEMESTAEYKSIITSCSVDGCLDVTAGEEEEEEVPPDNSNWVSVRNGSWGGSSVGVGGGCEGDKVVDAGTDAAYAEVGPATDAKGDYDDDEVLGEARTRMEEEEDQDDDHDDQPSPVSVLDSPFRYDNASDHDHDHYHEHEEDEDDDNEFSFSSNFDLTLANVERTKQRLLDSIKRFETLAGVADQPNTTTNITEDDDDLFSVEEEEEETTGFCGVEGSLHSDAESEEKEDDVQQSAAATSTPPGSDNRRGPTTITFSNSIITNELPTSTVIEELNPKGGNDELKTLNAAVKGCCRPVGSGVADAKERRALVREMEIREGQWGRFGEEEKEGVGCEFEVGLLSDLLDEVVNELVM